jgi:hypothetical protein
MLKKLIKQLTNKKTTHEQKLSMCEYLDQLQSKQLKGVVSK